MAEGPVVEAGWSTCGLHDVTWSNVVLAPTALHGGARPDVVAAPKTLHGWMGLGVLAAPEALHGGARSVFNIDALGA
jgi:hypothetical protein